MVNLRHGTLLLAAIISASFSTQHTNAAPSLQAAVLPTSRAIQIGSTATFFATMINEGDETATNCRIELPGIAAGDFSFQRTSAIDNARLGELNDSVDLLPGASQSFAIFIEASEAIPAGELAPRFICDNSPPATSYPQINTFDFLASASPVPDVIAFAATQSADGRLELLSEKATEAFVVAVANLGAEADIEFSASVSDPNLPLDTTWCITHPLTSECLSPPVGGTPSSVTMREGETATFAVFVAAQGAVLFQPARSRIVVTLAESGVTRSRVSVAPFTNQMRQRPDAAFGLRGAIEMLNGDPMLEEVSTDLLLQADGKLLVAGQTSAGRGTATSGSFLARFNSNGSRDTDFEFSEPYLGAWPGQLIALPEGKFLLIDGSVRRFNQDGSLDRSFGSNGKAVLPDPEEELRAAIKDAAVLPDGDIIAVGQTYPVAPKIWRFSADGVNDANFGGTLPTELIAPGSIDGLNYEFEKAVHLSDGNILVAGRGLSGSLMLVRFSADGTTDGQYGDSGLLLLHPGNMIDAALISLETADLEVLANGAVMVLADGHSAFGGALIKLTSEGLLDSNFGVGGVALTNATLSADGRCALFVSGLVALDSGSFVVTGSAAGGSGIERYLPDGSRDPEFGVGGCFRYQHNPGDGRHEKPVTVAETEDGRLVLLSNETGRADTLGKSRLLKIVEAP